MVPCIFYFELRFWHCFSCFCLLNTSCLLNYLREFPPPCSLITSCSLNYFERIFPPVRLLHPVLLIDSSEYSNANSYRTRTHCVRICSTAIFFLILPTFFIKKQTNKFIYCSRFRHVSVIIL